LTSHPLGRADSRLRGPRALPLSGFSVILRGEVPAGGRHVGGASRGRRR